MNYNSFPRAINLGKLRAVRVYQCTPRALPSGRLRFVRSESTLTWDLDDTASLL